MYYYLGIVTDEDILRGKIRATYILCKNTGPPAPGRSGLTVVKRDSVLKNKLRLLVTSFTGHDDLIEFLSNYRTYTKLHNKWIKITPKGALFWFPCDLHCRKKGPALFVCQVPNRESKGDKGLAYAKAMREEKKPLSALFAAIRDAVMYAPSMVKPKLPQSHVTKKEEEGRLDALVNQPQATPSVFYRKRVGKHANDEKYHGKRVHRPELD